MQLSHLIPHLDAEISRLERMRGLLSLHLEFIETHPEIDPAQIARARQSELRLAADTPVQVVDESDASTLTIHASSAQNGLQTHPPITRLKERRKYTRSDKARQDGRRRALALDTALRGPVPSGPVAVSAEEARRSQAAKAAQFTRAEEVKRAGADLIPNFNWRSKGSDVRHADALLQRLMSIGESNRDQAGLLPISAAGPHKSFDAANEPLTAKVD